MSKAQETIGLYPHPKTEYIDLSVPELASIRQYQDWFKETTDDAQSGVLHYIYAKFIAALPGHQYTPALKIMLSKKLFTVKSIYSAIKDGDITAEEMSILKPILYDSFIVEDFSEDFLEHISVYLDNDLKITRVTKLNQVREKFKGTPYYLDFIPEVRLVVSEDPFIPVILQVERVQLPLDKLIYNERGDGLSLDLDLVKQRLTVAEKLLQGMIAMQHLKIRMPDIKPHNMGVNLNPKNDNVTRLMFFDVGEWLFYADELMDEDEVWYLASQRRTRGYGANLPIHKEDPEYFRREMWVVLILIVESITGRKVNLARGDKQVVQTLQDHLNGEISALSTNDSDASFYLQRSLKMLLGAVNKLNYDPSGSTSIRAFTAGGLTNLLQEMRRYSFEVKFQVAQTRVKAIS